MTENKIRLFTAISAPQEVRKQYERLPEKYLKNPRWLHPDDLHITIRFLGDIDADMIPEIKDVLGQVRRFSFRIEMQGMDSFKLKRQAVLWAAIQSTRKLTALTGDVNEKLATLAFEMPAKPYVPHVTLARLKQSHGLETYIKVFGNQMKAAWNCKSFGLYRSSPPDEAGKRYEIISEYPLLQTI